MTQPVSTRTPTILFRGEYRFRTWDGTLTILVPLLVCMLFVAIAMQVFQESPFVAGGFAIFALVFGGLGLDVLVSWIGDQYERVQIDDEGITHRNQFTPWANIHSFRGERFDNGICLGHLPTAKFFWGDGSLPTTPLLTEQEYVDLARRLHSLISERFPDVVVYLHPVEPSL